MSTAATVANTARSVEALLGGRSVLRIKPRTSLDWVSVIRQGISSSAVDFLARTIHVTQSELATALGIPERTLARRKQEGTLNSEESAKLVRLARAVKRAEEVFEDLETALTWLKTPNAALLRATPLSLLDTDIGAESVMDTLGRIEHGVFA
jgi:putative toxin-antitoxin system antitoxin component (TIGR02293 family)